MQYMLGKESLPNSALERLIDNVILIASSLLRLVPVTEPDLPFLPNAGRKESKPWSLLSRRIL